MERPLFVSRYVLAVFAAALTLLALGISVYLFDRTPGSAQFLPSDLSMFQPGTGRFGDAGMWLPAFAHVYAFSLLTAVLWPASRLVHLGACAIWWGVDSLCEIGQHPALREIAAAAVAPGLDGIPVLQQASTFFLRGTFDPADLLAIAGGAVAAFLSLRQFHRRLAP